MKRKYFCSLLRGRFVKYPDRLVITQIVVFVCYRGTSGIDIDLQKVDIDQCPQNLTAPRNVFAGSAKCKQNTTKVRHH